MNQVAVWIEGEAEPKRVNLNSLTFIGDAGSISWTSGPVGLDVCSGVVTARFRFGAETVYAVRVS